MSQGTSPIGKSKRTGQARDRQATRFTFPEILLYHVVLALIVVGFCYINTHPNALKSVNDLPHRLTMLVIQGQGKDEQQHVYSANYENLEQCERDERLAREIIHRNHRDAMLEIHCQPTDIATVNQFWEHVHADFGAKQ